MNLIDQAQAQTDAPPGAAPAPAAPAAAPAATHIGTAVSDAPPPAPTMPDLFAQIVPIIVVMAVVYIIVIRPKQRAAKEQEAQLKNVRRGDTIVTTSGIIGKVSKATDDLEIELELGPNMKIRLLRTAIAEVRSRGEPVKDTPPQPKPAKEPAKKA
jgi:preprotein translocase subunit YajC